MLRTPTSIVALLGLIVFSPLLEGGTTHVAAMVIRLVILLLGCLFLAESFYRKTIAWPSLPVDWVVAAYLGMAAVSVLRSSYKEPSFQWTLVLLGYAGLLYLFVHFVARWEHVGAIVVVLVLMGLFESGLGLHQVLWHGAGRSTGTFFNPNFLAGYLAAIGCFITGILCFCRFAWKAPLGHRSSMHSNLVKWPLLGGALALMLLAITFTGSRAGFVALLTGISAVVGMRFGWKGVALVVVCSAAAFLLLPNPFRDRMYLEHVVNPEAYARWNIWKSSVYAMLDHPFGVGLGLYQYLYPQYAFPIEGTLSRYGRIAQTAHSEYLQMGVELGIAGLLIFLSGLMVLGREVRHVMRHRMTRWQRGLIAGAAGAISSIMIHAVFDSNLHEPGIAIVFIVSVGIVLVANRLKRRTDDPVRRVSLEPRPLRLAWASGAAVSVVLLLTAILRPGLAWTAYEEGAYAGKQQDHHTAIARYQAAIALQPGKALYHSSLAASYFKRFERTGDPAMADAAVKELETATDLNPADGRLWGLLGSVYRTLSESRHATAGEVAGADRRRMWRVLSRAAYEQAVTLEPFNVMHYFDLGRLHSAEGHREEAIAVLRQAVTIEPNFLPAREWLVRVSLESHDIAGADHEYREIAARRERFVKAATNAFETHFLSVDVGGLKAALDKAKGRI